MRRRCLRVIRSDAAHVLDGSLGCACRAGQFRPSRNYAVGAPIKPKQTPVFEAGRRHHPDDRLASGRFVCARPVRDVDRRLPPGSRRPPDDAGQRRRRLRIPLHETDWRDRPSSFETSTVPAIAYEWFVQGIQTLSPRWFVAARQEGTSAPPLRNGIIVGVPTSLKTWKQPAAFG